jgi:hypothetical protein
LAQVKDFLVIMNRWYVFLGNEWLVILSLSLVLAILIGTMLFIPSHAQSDWWSTPINISDTPNGSWFPDLAVDNMGNVHVVWCETEWDEFQTGTEYLFYSQRNSQGWTQPNDLVAASRWIHRSSIAVDTLGNLYLTFLEDNPPRYGRGVYFGYAPVNTAYSAASWSDWRFIGGSWDGYVSDIVVDRENQLHVIYSESSGSDPSDLCPQGNCSDVFYRNSQDGGRNWSAPVNLSRSAPGTKRIGLMVDGQGSIHAFWDEGGDRYQPDVPIGVAHTVSHDGGLSWSTPVLVTSAFGMPHQIIAGFDGRGQTIIAWRTANVSLEGQPVADDHVYYQVSADGVSWSAPVPIPGILAREDVAQYDEYGMATDSAGDLHFVGSVRLSTSDPTPGIFHLQWDGERWSAPERISTGSGYPEHPRIVIENGNVLHVVWAVRGSRGYNPQQIDVWYCTKQLASPAWTPVPTPVPLATPTLTPLSSPVATVTPYPTLGSVSTGLPTGLYTEYDEILQLMVALVPVVLLVIVIVVAKLGWLSKLFR